MHKQERRKNAKTYFLLANTALNRMKKRAETAGIMTMFITDASTSTALLVLPSAQECVSKSRPK
jgi:hypothetical protein